MKKQKKISINHLEKKSGLSKESLQEMFFANGVTKKEKAKKVNKKAAKFFLRDQQGLNQYGYAKFGFLDGMKLRRWSLLALGLLGLGGLFGLGLDVTSTMQNYASQVAETHAVASIGYASDTIDAVMYETEKSAIVKYGGEVLVHDSERDFIDSMADTMVETGEGKDGTDVHFISPTTLPKTGS